LHDDVTQRLARLAIDAALAERGVALVSEDGGRRSMREELVRLSEDVHSIAYRLHPSILDELGLNEAIRAECDLFALRGSLCIKLKTCDIPGQVSRETALCLFRIAQEALRNVERHAHAKTVNVSISLVEGGLQLAVRDDGVGFEPTERRRKPTLGLASMSERLSLLQGELDIESQPGSGTTILAWAPFDEEVKNDEEAACHAG
jgi:signal transduction histidine kinase